MNKGGKLSLIALLFFSIAVVITSCGGSGNGGATPPSGSGSFTYAVGGMVNGIPLGESVVLQNNGGDDLTISADGAFTFITTIADGAGYKVTVKTQPQTATCTVANGNMTISGADVSDVKVTCYLSGTHGTLDASFNSTGPVPGMVTYNGGYDDFGSSITTDANGNILVTGESLNSNNHIYTNMVIWRYKANGTPDTSFNSNGSAPGMVTYDSGNNDKGYSITTDANGNILVTGESFNGTNSIMAIWRYKADGTPDTSFNSTGSVPGMVTYNGGSNGSVGFSITTNTNGNILVTGYDGNDMSIWRYKADGTPDTSFNSTGSMPGLVTYNSVSGNEGNFITTDTNGNILVTGFSNNGSDMAIWRYKADGTPDTSFNSTGSVPGMVTYNSGRGYSITTDANGKILVSGASGIIPHMAIWRYKADGTPDTSFNSIGSIPGMVTYDGGRIGKSITIDAIGKILVTGFTDGTNQGMAIWRYKADGTPDTSFNSTGSVPGMSITYDSGSQDEGSSITIDATGKILVTGFRYSYNANHNNYNHVMAIWRYIP